LRVNKTKDAYEATFLPPEDPEEYKLTITILDYKNQAMKEIKANLTNQLTDAIKESAFDCYIYSNGKCVNFGDPNINKSSYVPDYDDQQNDTTIQANRREIEWTGKPINIHGIDYVYRRISPRVLNIYDKKSYQDAMNDPSIIPLQVATLEKNEKGENVFKTIVLK